LGKRSPVARGHVADVLGHLQGEVELRGHLGNVLLQLCEMLLELLVAKDRVLIVGWVVHDAASELCLGSDGDKKKRNQTRVAANFLKIHFIGTSSLISVSTAGLAGIGMGSCWLAVAGHPGVSRVTFQ